MSALLETASDASGPAPPGSGPALRFRERVRLRAGEATLMVFHVGGEHFAVELQAVDEVVEAPLLHSLPDGPAELLGVFALRDALLPLFAPAGLLGLQANRSDVALVMRSGARRVALAVDEVEDVLTVTLSDLREAPVNVNEDEIVAGLLWRDGSLTTVLDARTLVGACAHVPMPNAA